MLVETLNNCTIVREGSTESGSISGGQGYTALGHGSVAGAQSGPGIVIFVLNVLKKGHGKI